MPFVLLLARIFFVLIFFVTAPENFTADKAKKVAAGGLPFASLLVPLAAAIALVGAISILLGIKAQWGAGLIVLFLVPVTLVQHNFWKYDGQIRRTHYLNFLKNLGLLGGALYIMVFGSGVWSLDMLF